jgi:flagellar basal-body rod protein FlgF
MDQGIYTAAAGAMAMEVKLAVIANNIANANTVGFKKEVVTFEEYLKQLDTSPLVPVQYQRIPEDVITKEYYIDTSQGPSRQTGNPLDMAIIGDGYFVVNTEQGPRYTRSGSFQKSPAGVLVDFQGNPVQGEGGDIPIASGEVIIARDGTVSVNEEVVDKLQVMDIASEALQRMGNNYFEVKQGFAPAAKENPVIEQAALEFSNVDVVKEMLGLIETQRAYESFQKMMRTVSDAYGQAIHNVGTVG